jgi:dTMP kinase
MSKPYAGLFISIEGGDGSGKSTLAHEMTRILMDKGYKVHATREPGGTSLSEKIRDLILHPESSIKIGNRAEMLLFLAARAQHIDEVIQPKLRAGEIVICERFSDSTIAYQGSARHLGTQEVETLCKLSVHLEPDLTFLLDIDPHEGLKRVREKRKSTYDRLENEQAQFHSEVRQGYLHLADRYPNRIIILDASLPKEQLLAKALTELEPRLLLKPASPLR